jgi:hypothetical protein
VPEASPSAELKIGSLMTSRNLKSSCFHISLWNFEKQEIVETAYGC